MGVGVEATALGVRAEVAASSARSLGQPAFGEYVAYPEAESQEEATEECAADRFARRIKWPALFALAALEVAWLAALASLIHRIIP